MGQIASANGIDIVFMGFTGSGPDEIARNPEEYDRLLTAFAEAQSRRPGVRTSAATLIDRHPAIDLNEVLLEAIDTIGADLRVQSHEPGLLESFWSSHDGRIKGYAPVSVFVVR